MSLKVVTLAIILGTVSVVLYVSNEMSAQADKKQEIDNSSPEQASSVGCPSAEVMSQNAAASGLTEADIDALEQMNQQNGGIVAEPMIRERTPDGEIIYESRAVQTVTSTNIGVVRCSSFGNEMTTDSTDEITYIGGPLDNQEK